MSELLLRGSELEAVGCSQSRYDCRNWLADRPLDTAAEVEHGRLGYSNCTILWIKNYMIRHLDKDLRKGPES